MDEIFTIHEDLLSFQHVPERYTGKNLAAHIFKILQNFNIHTKLFCITTDSASNNDKMMKELSKLLRQKTSIKWNDPTHHIPYFAYIINLVMKAFLGNLKIDPLNEEHEWMLSFNRNNDDDNNSDDDDDSDGDGDDDDDSDDDSDDDQEYSIDNTRDFKSVLQKIRTISKAANFSQNRILAFQQFCIASNIKPLRPIRDHAIRWSATFNILE